MIRLIGITLVSTLLALSAQAQAPAVKVEGAWARATVPGQKGTGAFMTLTAQQGLRLVGVDSPVAGVAEIHEMKMEGDVMRMRAMPALDLPAGQSVVLRPGGYHLMLMDLKQPLLKDSQVPLTLRFVDAQGKSSQMQLSLPIALNPPAGAAKASGGHAGHKHH